MLWPSEAGTHLHNHSRAMTRGFPTDVALQMSFGANSLPLD